MADHLSIQIRDRVVELVTGLDTTGENVFKSLVYPLATTALPGIIVRLGSERVQARTLGMPRGQERTREVAVVGCAKDTGDLDATLAQIGKEIEIALAMPIVGPWKLLTLTSVDPRLDGSSDKPTGQIVMTYEAFYVVRENAPDVAQ